MKREKLVEWYGKRFATTSRIAGFFLIIAFGIFMAFSQDGQQSVEHKAKIEHSAK